MWAILPLRASRAVAAARRCPVYAVLLSVLLSSYGSMQSRRLRALRAFVYRLRNVHTTQHNCRARRRRLWQKLASYKTLATGKKNNREKYGNIKRGMKEIY